MKLTFLGTRGYINSCTEKHYRHSSTKISYYDVAIIIDCGEDWLDKVQDWQADAILVTHAHPDHAFGLENGAPCPVYATEDSWETMDRFDIKQKETVIKRTPFLIPDKGEKCIEIEAFTVLHSTRAPAVGYRLTAGEASIFYVPDVAWIKDRESAMHNIDVYVGDGASVKRSMVRKPGDTIIGHVPIQTQLTWCKKMGVSDAIFTHLGSQIVDGDPQEIQKKVEALAKERDVSQVTIAYDGMTRLIR